MTPDEINEVASKSARQLAVALWRIAERLEDPIIPDDERAGLAEQVRMFVRTDRGIPSDGPGTRGFTRVLILNLSAWIQQAREGHLSGELLRARCVEVLDRFAEVPLSEYQRVIAGTRRYPCRVKLLPADSGALELAEAAGLSASDVSVRTLRSKSRYLQKSTSGG